MCGIRNIRPLFALFALVMLAAAGCQRVTTPPQSAGPAIATDEIRQTRAEWPKSTAHFANGDVVACHNGVVFVPAGSEAAQGLMNVPVFLANTALLPVTLIGNSGEQTYTGVQFEPTYTAVPPEK